MLLRMGGHHRRRARRDHEHGYGTEAHDLFRCVSYDQGTEKCAPPRADYDQADCMALPFGNRLLHGMATADDLHHPRMGDSSFTVPLAQPITDSVHVRA
jgi:hypothetical protein